MQMGARAGIEMLHFKCPIHEILPTAVGRLPLIKDNIGSTPSASNLEVASISPIYAAAGNGADDAISIFRPPHSNLADRSQTPNCPTPRPGLEGAPACGPRAHPCLIFRA